MVLIDKNAKAITKLSQSILLASADDIMLIDPFFVSFTASWSGSSLATSIAKTQAGNNVFFFLIY